MAFVFSTSVCPHLALQSGRPHGAATRRPRSHAAAFAARPTCGRSLVRRRERKGGWRPYMVSTQRSDVPPRAGEEAGRGERAEGGQSDRKTVGTATAVTAAAAAVVGATAVAVANRGALAAALGDVTARAAALGPVRGAAALGALNFCTVLFCFPANMGLMIAAGAVLGPGPAFVALFTSKLAAASVAFALARGVLYERARRALGAYPKLARLLMDTGREGGWKFVLLMRLSPFPGFLLNYLLSFTGVSFGAYIGATMLGIAPSILNLVLVGATAKDVGLGVAEGGAAVRGGWLGVAIKAVCMVSMIVVTVFVTRKARKAFAQLNDHHHHPDNLVVAEESKETLNV